jgi:hypothetical protein
MANRDFKYKVYCYITGFTSYSNNYNDADNLAFRRQCQLFDNLTGKMLKDYE